MITEPNLHHVCVRVSNLAMAEKFYTDLLGLKKIWSFDLLPEHAHALLSINQVCRFVTFSCSPGRIEIFSPLDPMPVPVAGQHFSLTVQDREMVLAKLQKAQVPRREVWRENHRVIFVSDPDGNWIEIKDKLAANKG